MEISTFNDDLFELEDFSRQLDDFISTEHDYVEGSLVIALTSKYGSGKTTFLEMWKSSMSNSDNSADKPLVISLNAWESDYCGDPLFAIISALIECLEINGKKNQVDKLVNAAKKLGLFVAVIGNQLATKMTGIDMGAASAAVKKKKINVNKPLKPSLIHFLYIRAEKVQWSLLSVKLNQSLPNSNREYYF
jgi:hypothetical protein